MDLTPFKNHDKKYLATYKSQILRDFPFFNFLMKKGRLSLAEKCQRNGLLYRGAGVASFRFVR